MSELDDRERVVVGVDGSPGSLTALKFAFDEAKRRSIGLLVVTAFEIPDIRSVGKGLAVSRPEHELRDNTREDTRREVAEALGDRMTADGAPEIDVVARRGGAVHVLVTAAAGNPLLVVGRRGRGGFRSMLLGSVSLQCVLHAPCPITVVHSAADRDHSQVPPSHTRPQAGP